MTVQAEFMSVRVVIDTGFRDVFALIGCFPSGAVGFGLNLANVIRSLNQRHRKLLFHSLETSGWSYNSSKRHTRLFLIMSAAVAFVLLFFGCYILLQLYNMTCMPVLIRLHWITWALCKAHHGKTGEFGCYFGMSIAESWMANTRLNRFRWNTMKSSAPRLIDCSFKKASVRQGSPEHVLLPSDSPHAPGSSTGWVNHRFIQL